MTDKETFLKDGVCIVRNYFDPEVLHHILHDLLCFKDRAPIERGHMVEDQKDGKAHLKYFQYVNTYIKSFDRLYSSRLLKLACEFLGDEAYFTSMGVHNKSPGIGTVTPPHQDNFYSCRVPPNFITAYIPLLPMSEANGGIQYLLGSHNEGVFPHHASVTPGFSSAISQDVTERYEILKPLLNVGDITLHHGNIIHFAQENNSTDDRYAVAVGIFGEQTVEDSQMRSTYIKNLDFNRAYI